MNTLLLTALFASMTAMGGMKAPTDTIDRYIVNGMVMDDIDGAELHGEITNYECDYFIKANTIGKKGGEIVIREHNINVTGRIDRKINTSQDNTVDKLSYAEKMSSYPAYQNGGIYGGVPDTARKPAGQVMVNRSVSAYTDYSINYDDVLVIIDGRESKNGLSSVNSQNVSSIEYLKGSSATNKYGDKGRNGVIIVKTKGEPEFEGAKYLVNGKEMTKEELARMDKSQIKTINIEHTELDLDNYKEGLPPIVIETTTQTTYAGNSINIYDPFEDERMASTQGNSFVGPMTKTRSESHIETSFDLGKCIVVIDGKESKRGLSSVKPETVGSVYVMKADEAKEKYGDKGHNGVILITTIGKEAPDYTKYIVDGKEISKEDFSRLNENDYRWVTIIKRDYDLNWYFKTGANILIVKEEISAKGSSSSIEITGTFLGTSSGMHLIGGSADRPINNTQIVTYGGKVEVIQQTKENNHEYVDLGLSVKWATCNVGAEVPEEFGDYFAWGETSPKSKYTWSTYRYCPDGEGKKFSKYVYRTRQGERDGKTILDLVDDAAHANWGGNWRMPTNDELAELREGCRFVLEELNGVKGLRAYSKVNKNSIFIPFAGGYGSNGLAEVGIAGEYWSSELQYRADIFNGGSTLAKCSVFPPKEISYGEAPRFLGMPVRPVYP